MKEKTNIGLKEELVPRMKKWLLITNLYELDQVVEKLKIARVMAIDTETTGLDPYRAKLRLIQIAVENETTVILDCFKLLPEGLEQLREIMQSKAIKVFQNAKFDIQFLETSGIVVSGNLFDTMIAAQLLRTSGGPKKVGLGQLAEHFLGETMSKEEQTSDFSGELSITQLDYAAKDAEVLLRLREEMLIEFKRNKLLEVARLEFVCVYAVASMEYSGIYVDLNKVKKLTSEIEKDRDKALEELYPYIGYPTEQMGMFESKTSNHFNLNSNKQVLKLLSDFGINVENASRHTLASYENHQMVSSLLKYRHATKALTTFLYTIPEQINPITNRLHPRYGQNGAWSGRMSCVGPNIQAIPREKAFRDCFIAPKGRKLVIADYSQIELRVIAEFSGDKRMIEAYKNKEDLHKLTASLILQKEQNMITKAERQAAKAVNFGLVFGMGAKGLKTYASETYGTNMTMEEAELFKKRFFSAYKGVDLWHQHIRKTMPTSSRTLSGRKHNYSSDSGISGRYNTPIQGSAADILKNALGMLYISLKDTDTKIVAVVHDEIVLECDENRAQETAELLTEIMESAGRRYMKDVPVVAEAGIADSWADK